MRHYLAKLQKHAIILFDGDCNFCNRSVQFIMRRDHKDYFRFASLQSSIGQSLLAHYVANPPYDSIVFIENDQVFTESTAVLRICRRMVGLWKALYALIILPKPLRDLLYRSFAKRRYALFGKQVACLLPTPEIRKKFLSMDENRET